MIESSGLGGSAVWSMAAHNSLSPAQRAALQRSYTAPGLHDDAFVADWVRDRRAQGTLQVRTKPLSGLRDWSLDPVSGNLLHRNGNFFSITGMSVRHRISGGELEWDQPIIDQPEIGILGILGKEIDGVLHFCLQAKEEPGNLHGVQLSPTVQATFSNYMQSHGGRRPLFVEYFLDPRPDSVFYAKLQTEDGGRFLYKSNRNMIIQVDEDQLHHLPPVFIWLTLRQIVRLLHSDNLVHATTRSVLSGLLLAAEQSGRVLEHLDQQRLLQTLQWYDNQAAKNHFLVKRVNLNTLQEWHLDGQGCFSHRQQRFFQIIGLEVAVSGREVSGWDQPILHNPEAGIIGLLMQRRGGERFFLMQAKAEPGNRTGVQLGPTVQFTPGNYSNNQKLTKPFLFDEFLGPRRTLQLADTLQPEEGARFYLENHHHRILELPEGEALAVPEDFRWVSADELHFFLLFGQQVNSCARSVLACTGGLGERE